MPPLPKPGASLHVRIPAKAGTPLRVNPGILKAVQDQGGGLAQHRRSLSLSSPTPGVAAAVQQQTQQLAGSPHSSVLQLGSPGLDEPLLRASLSLDENLDELNATFQKRHPNGSIAVKIAYGEPTLVFRKEKEDQWSMVDAPVGEEGMLPDMMDFVGDVPEILGELVALVNSRGLTLPAFTRRLFLGGFGGHSVEELGEMMAGTQKESAGEVIGGGLLEGTISSVGGLLTLPISGGVNIIRGAGTMKRAPGSSSAELAAKRISAETGVELPALMPHQLTLSPLLRKMAGQAGATLSTIQQYWLRQQSEMVRAFKRLNLDDPAKRGNLTYVLAREAAERTHRIEKLIRRKITSKKGGENLKKGLEEYDEIAQANVNSLYKTAREVETPVFDFDAALKLADDIEMGAPAMARPQTVTKADPYADVDLMAGERGVTKEILPPEILNVSRPPDSRLQQVIDNLRQIDPNVEEVVIDGVKYTQTDALLAMRQQLWDLKTPPKGEPRRIEHRDAARMYNKITEMVDNPVGGSGVFKQAWEAARTAARERFQVWDNAIIQEISRTDTPANLASRLLSTGVHVDEIGVIKEILPANRWNIVQNHLESILVGKGSAIGRTLDEMDGATLDAIMSKERQQVFRKLGDSLKRLEDMKVVEALETQAGRGNQARILLENQNTLALDELIKTFPAGSEGRRQLRAGLLDTIIKDSIIYSKSGAISAIDSEIVTATMKRLKKSGANKVLTPRDWRSLHDFVNYARRSHIGADVGTSIQASETAAGLRELKGSAFRTVLENLSFGWFMTSERGFRILLGKGKGSPRPQLQLNWLKGLGAAFMTAATDLRNFSAEE